MADKLRRRVKIITDSGCDISRENERKYEIDIMPFTIVIDDQEYTDRIDVEKEEFYDLINQSPSIPKTSQVTVIRFEEKFEECYKAGYDDVIVVLINSAGSQTYSNAVLAKRNTDGQFGEMNIHVIDSHSYSLAYGYPVVEAAKKLEAGQSVQSVVGFLEDWFNCCEIYLLTFDLRHAKKSGRISAAASFLGELMGLRPIISMIDEKTEVVKKARGDLKAIEECAKHSHSRAIPQTPWLLVKTGIRQYDEQIVKLYTKMTGQPPSMSELSGAVVAANAGTKFIGVIIKGSPRR